MLPPVDNLLASDGPIARRLEGYEPRRQQIEMASAVPPAPAPERGET